MEEKIKQIRQALADYIDSEGCDCCENTPKHNQAKKRLAELLEVPTYETSSDYNFYKFKTKKQPLDTTE